MNEENEKGLGMNVWSNELLGSAIWPIFKLTGQIGKIVFLWLCLFFSFQKNWIQIWLDFFYEHFPFPSMLSNFISCPKMSLFSLSSSLLIPFIYYSFIFKLPIILHVIFLLSFLWFCLVWWLISNFLNFLCSPLRPWSMSSLVSHLGL